MIDFWCDRKRDRDRDNICMRSKMEVRKYGVIVSML